MNIDFMDELPELMKRLNRLVQTGVKPGDAADQIAAQVPAKVARGLAMLHLLDMHNRERRAEVREVERRSEAVPPKPAGYRKGDKMPRRGSKAWRELEATEDGREALAQQRADDRQQRDELAKEMQRVTNIYTEQIKMQWTLELLASSFSLADGSAVTWGAATIEQHEARQAMFVQNAHANLEGAARHEHAIRDLRAANAICLNELAQVAA